jgi:hypothetical protein
MASILDSIKEHITPELLGEAATMYEESEAGISKAISSLAPAVLAGLLGKSGDSHLIDDIFSIIRNFDPVILQDLGPLFRGNNPAQTDRKDDSDQLLDTIFGAKIPAIVNAAASFSEVKQATASSLLRLAAPLVMALLSKKINAERLNSSGMVNYLLAEKSNFVSVLPASIAAMLGIANRGIDHPFIGEKSMGGLSWLWPLLVLTGIGMVILFYRKGC